MTNRNRRQNRPEADRENKNTGTNNNGSGAKGTSGGSSVKSPKTKDEARTGMFAGLFAVSAAGIIVLEMKKKRSRR